MKNIYKIFIIILLSLLIFNFFNLENVKSIKNKLYIDYETKLIDSYYDYYDFGYNLSLIDDPIIYKRNCIIEFNLPIYIKFKSNKNFLLNKNFLDILSNKNINYIYDIYILNNYTKNYQTKEYIHKEEYLFLENGSKKTIINTTENIIKKTQNRYFWQNINEFLKNDKSFKNNDFLIINIKCKKKANIGFSSFDIIPKIKIENNEKKLYKYEWWDSNWNSYKILTINSDQVVNTMKNFPVLLNMTDVDLKNYAQSDFDDIVFVSIDNNTVYPHEIEYYDSNLGKIVCWINISDLKSDIDTELLMYFNNSECSSQEDIENVWDDNFIMVHHMEESANAIYDSTINNCDSIYKSGNPSFNENGIVGECILFDSSYDAFNLNTYFSYDDDEQYSFECFVKPVSTSAYRIMNAGYLSSGASDGFLWRLNDGGASLNFAVFSSGSGDYYTCYYDLSDTNKFIYLSVVHEFGDGSKIVFYHNGSVMTGAWNSHGNYIPVNDPNLLMSSLYITDYDEGNFDGYIDEYRISNILRNQSYFIITYNTVINSTINLLNSFISVSCIYDKSAPVEYNYYNKTESDERYLVANFTIRSEFLLTIVWFIIVLFVLKGKNIVIVGASTLMQMLIGIFLFNETEVFMTGGIYYIFILILVASVGLGRIIDSKFNRKVF